MEPGIYYDMPFAEYKKIDAISNSLASLIEECPALLRAELDSPEERESKALLFGRATHEALFFRDLYLQQKNFMPTKKFGRSAAEQDAKKKFLDENKDKGLLDEDDYNSAIVVADSVRSTNTGKKLLDGAKSEVTIVWKDVETGVLCKGRVDSINESLEVILDLKTTTSSLHDASLMKIISVMRYYRQLAWYQVGLKTLGLSLENVILIFVNKQRPYPVVFRSLDFDSLEQGRREMSGLVKKYAECLSTNKWPSFSDRIKTIGLPEWAKKYETSADFSGLADFNGENIYV